MRTYLVVYFGAAFVAILATPLVTRLARRHGLVDRPGVRKIHTSPVPRIGGLIIAASVLALAIPASVLDNAIGDAFRRVPSQVTAILLASVSMFFIGLIDDVRGMRAIVKLAAQVAAASVVCAAGVRIDEVNLGDWLTLDLGPLAWPVTILWIVGITNAVNLIDGLDGLAAGICAVACGVTAFFALVTGQPVMAVILLALLGGLTGFLFFNFNPAKVFMGDSGTMFVGFLLAASSVMCAAKSAALVGLALPALALGVPIFDTLFSILRRILERRSIFAPDGKHIHHRLLSIGLTQRRAVAVMYLVTLAAAGLGVLMLYSRHAMAVVMFLCGALLIVAVFRITGAIRLRESLALMRRDLAMARHTKMENRHFEEAQLRLREATSFEDWWKTLCGMAECLGFARLAVSLSDDDHTTWNYVWRAPGADPPPNKTITMTIPVRDGLLGPAVQIEAVLKTNGSLESSGHCAGLLGRLLDESMFAWGRGGRPSIGVHLIPRPLEVRQLSLFDEPA